MNINLTNVQSKAKVISANETAVNDGNYTVVANATFTDPSPVEGKGFRVFVRNGTAIVGGTSYAVAGTQIVRLFHSGSWANYTNITDLSGYVPTTRTINGLDLSVNRTLSASDVGAPSGSGTSTGTNTGDETQSSILTKLGFFLHKQTTPNASVTGTAEAIIGSVEIGGNRLATSDKLIIDSSFVKTTTLGTFTLRCYLAPNSNNLIGATEIARASGFSATTVLVPSFPRNYDINGGNLKGFPFTQTTVVPSATTTPISTVAFDVSATFYLITTVTFANAGDSGYLNSQLIKNF